MKTRVRTRACLFISSLSWCVRPHGEEPRSHLTGRTKSWRVLMGKICVENCAERHGGNSMVEFARERRIDMGERTKTLLLSVRTSVNASDAFKVYPLLDPRERYRNLYGVTSDISIIQFEYSNASQYPEISRFVKMLPFHMIYIRFMRQLLRRSILLV